MDTSGLLKLLNENEVKYVVIGATSFSVHGYARATMDIDIFIEPSPENIKKVRKALQSFGYDLEDVSEQDMLENKLLLRQYLVETDIHPFVKGVNFEEVWNNRVIDEISGIPVNFSSLDDLIKMKKAAGRPKDVEDLKALKELKKRKKNKL